MRMMILVLSLFAATTAFAEGGKEIGNGGKGLVCHRDTPEMKVRVLDMIKAVDAWGFQLVPADGKDEIEKAVNLAKRIGLHETQRAERYTYRIEHFLENSRMFDNYDLFNTDDSTEIGVPDGCEIKLIVNQKAPVFAEDRLYRINEKLWDKLSLDDRAALILHEVIYTDALSLGQTVSDDVTYFNSYINSDKIFTREMLYDSDTEYQSVLVAIHFPYYYRGWTLDPAELALTFYPGKLPTVHWAQRIVVQEDDLIDSYGGDYASVDLVKDELRQGSYRSIEFYPDGSLRGAYSELKQHHAQVREKWEKLRTGAIQKGCTMVTPEYMYFNPSGTLRYARLAHENTPEGLQQTRTSGCTFNVRLKDGTLKPKHFHGGTWFEFDDQGVVLKSSRFFKFRNYGPSRGSKI